MAPGKTKKRHGYGSKKKKLKYKAGLDLKKRTKDVDQIHASVTDTMITGNTEQPINYDLPGAGQHYCMYCDRYFVNLNTKKEHMKTKFHRRRKHVVDTEAPYTHEEAQAAAGMAPADSAKNKTQLYARQENGGAVAVAAAAGGVGIAADSDDDA